MAGESAREVARRAREQAERLNKRAELFEKGAEGEAETARALAALPHGWTVLHDVKWPGRRLANVDHVVIGPSGIFVIDSKNWSGRVTTAGGVLRQNGYSREKVVAGAADAALAVAERAHDYAPFVHPVICFAGRDDVSAWCRDVAVCCTANLVDMLQTWPTRLTPEHVADASVRLDVALRAASSTQRSRKSAKPTQGSHPGIVRMLAADAERRAIKPHRARSRGPSLTRFLVGVAMLFVLVSMGPQLAAGLGALIAGQLTGGLGTSECEIEQATGPDSREQRKPQRTAPPSGDVAPECLP